MGKLAKIAIVQGKKVPVDKARQQSVPEPVSNSFILSLLENQGFRTIADKVVNNIVLSPREIELLLSAASLPVLMKLAEIRLEGKKVVEPELVPVLNIPLETMLVRMDPDEIVEIVVKKIHSFKISNINVHFEIKEFSDLEDVWGGFFEEVKQECPDIKIIGPSLDTIYTWLGFTKGRLDLESVDVELEQLVTQLRAIGIEDLGLCSSRKLLRAGYAAGFRNRLCTKIETFPTYRLLAREYARVHRVSQKAEYFSEWSAGYLSNSFRKGMLSAVMPDVSLQLVFIRSFLTGVIAISGNHSISMYSRFLNSETISFMKGLGLIDKYYLSLDDNTSKQTGLMYFDEVGSIFKSKQANN